MPRRPHGPLDAAIRRTADPLARVEPSAPTLSARAALLLAAEGPLPPVDLMRRVCRVDRLQAEAAARMADVLLGQRPEFVLLDDDRWALLRDGTIVLAPAGTDGDALPSPAAERPAVGPVATPAPSLRDLRFAVVDVETTGSQPGLWDRVTEIAIVPVEQGRVGEPWSQLVHPGRPIPPMITALTGISDAMVANAPRFAEIADEVVTRLHGRVFTAHNAPFDRRFVDAELMRARGEQLAGTPLCTVRLTRRLVPTLPRRSLDRVTAYFGITIAARHRAAGDAVATAHVLVRLLEIADERDVRSWASLSQLLGTAPRRRGGRPSALPTSVVEDTSA
jgi:DNA polymerase III subunit epsilon